MKVKCPRCGREGYLYGRSSTWTVQVYVLHPVKREGRWTKDWCLILSDPDIPSPSEFRRTGDWIKAVLLFLKDLEISNQREGR